MKPERTSAEEKAQAAEAFQLIESGEFPRKHHGWWWLSFANDDGFLGAAVVFGEDVTDAAATAWILGCNPGGQVVGIPLLEDDLVPGEQWRARLLSLDECRKLDDEMSEGDEG